MNEIKNQTEIETRTKYKCCGEQKIFTFYFCFSSLSLAFHFEFTTENIYFKNWFDYVCNTFDFCMVGHKTRERERKTYK